MSETLEDTRIHDKAKAEEMAHAHKKDLERIEEDSQLDLPYALSSLSKIPEKAAEIAGVQYEIKKIPDLYNKFAELGLKQLEESERKSFTGTIRLRTPDVEDGQYFLELESPEQFNIGKEYPFRMGRGDDTFAYGVNGAPLIQTIEGKPGESRIFGSTDYIVHESDSHFVETLSKSDNVVVELEIRKPVQVSATEAS